MVQLQLLMVKTLVLHDHERGRKHSDRKQCELHGLLLLRIRMFGYMI
jgi:hypothetical protein